jgi:hypothetical protein
MTQITTEPERAGANLRRRNRRTAFALFFLVLISLLAFFNHLGAFA